MASNKSGYEYQGHYLPLTSIRSCANARVSYVTSVGVNVESLFWTCTPFGYYSYTYAAALKAPANFSEKYDKGETKSPEKYSVDYHNNADACPVRCIKE